MAKAPVAPTLDGRIETLDAIRGIAILGILLANIAAFSGPELGARLSGIQEVGRHPVEAFTVVFVNGKFRSMLAMLFGAGVALQFAKREAAGASWPGSYLRRTLLLALIGLFHYVLIWYGDILFPYAIVAAIVSVFALMPETVRRVLTLIGVILSGGLMLGLVVLTIVSEQLAKMFADKGTEELAREIRVFQSGSYAEQIAYRIETLPAIWLSYLFVVIAVTPLFLVGFELGRSGILADRERGRKIVRAMAVFGLGVGLPLNASLLLPFWTPHPSALELMVEFIGGPTLSVGYLASIVLWVWSGRAAALRRRIQDIGRMALSNYLLQSVLCTTLFYSWGFARFDRWHGYLLTAVVLGVWVANAAFTRWWLRNHVMGPVEWLWRCAAEGRRFPLRRVAEAARA
ncbi:MAG: DUF418 domain-containing protein [Fimbriimonadaceae bacterium]|nr:DUF418 domain-containing protein [Fimbriimonadaceae bacterium]